MTRTSGIALFLYVPFALFAQGGDKELRAKAEALFAQGEYAQAFQPYQTLVGNNQEDFDLNYRYGVCALHSGVDKEEAIKYLKRSTMGPSPQALAWYFLGKAYHLSYRFKEALVAYERYRGTADKKTLGEFPVEALELQCRNGQNLLSNLKEIDVHNKLEVAGDEFFRFYDLSSIGGRIVVTPDEIQSTLDKKSKVRALVYLPDKGGPIYFASYGKGGDTGRDIYRTEVMPTGEFATPLKLAGYINTAQDEDFPFMAPDGKSFYFCSKGHNSMGGYDVFKSSYDKGLDVFGAPVNMDFAVNTPDDDVFYLTDPEGREACFASGRDSKQGMLHVYRVSTAQAPVNITVLKGTFASQFDVMDRKARVRVLDALTQETVADVKTDQNGNYVLSLPRSGKYRFMVEAGPSGKTHVGVVDVPRNDEPRAYRQELSLVDQGGEKLMIKNYFDQPLEEDMIALALDEIRRRAKLDVDAPPVVEAPEVPATGDPLTRAGFAGNITATEVQKMADEDADYLRTSTEDLEQRTVAAFSVAMQNARLADEHTARAESLVAQANAAPDETVKNALMTDAARERQAARAANKRATAALRAGEGFNTERMSTSLRALKAEKLSGDLTRVMAGKDENAMVVRLVELRTRMDEKNAPDGSLTAAEKMRRSATDREGEATAAMQRANTARGEENELVDRVARKKREETAAKGNKKEQLARERAELEQQLQAMREENDRAFAKARIAELETANAKGQAALAKHLEASAPDPTATKLTDEEVAQLAQRISGTGSRIASLAVDERFDALIAAETREIERTLFDWGTPIGTGTQEPLASTRTADRDTSLSVQRTERDQQTIAQADLPAGQILTGRAVEAPAPLTAIEQEPDGSGVMAGAAVQTDPSGRNTSDLASMKGAVPLAMDSDSTSVDMSPQESETEGRLVAEEPAEQTTPEDLAFVQANELAELRQVRAAEKNKVKKDSLDRRIADLEQAMRASQEASDIAAADTRSGSDTSTGTLTDAGQVAEADPDGQPGAALVAGAAVAAAADNSTGNNQDAGADAQRSDAVPEPAGAGQDEGTAEEPGTDRPALTFDEAVSETALIADVYPDYPSSRQRMEREITDTQEQSAALHGLELMLVDSIDAEKARQLEHLDRHPEEAAVVLKRVERLRLMKEDHLREADRVLLEGQQVYGAGESRAVEDEIVAQGSEGITPMDRAIPASTTPHNDDYVRIMADPEQVYASNMDHRSDRTAEAIRDRDRDMETLTGLEDRIDSLEGELEDMPMGKEQTKLRDRTDRLIDDHMILRTEIGQRMGYITKQEYEAALDSSKALIAATGSEGLAPNEPLIVLARSMEESAQRAMDRAAEKRKQAERSEDIVVRDSLFRTAYATELEALKEMDRSLTVRNHILSDGFVRGEALGYEEVERRMFAPAVEPAVATIGEQEETPDTTAALPLTADTRTAPLTTTPVVVATTTAVPTGGFVEGNLVKDQPEDAGVSALRTEARTEAQRSRQLEEESLLAADRASALQDSAASAKRSDRARLEGEAMQQRALSDSLHQASVLSAERSVELERLAAEAQEALALRQRLLKYYYLSDEEQILVMSEEDRSRYFQAKAKALEQREAAVHAREQAAGSKELAAALLEQSKAILANPNADGAPLTPEQMEQASLLTEQAVRMNQRADSLKAAEQRLISAATLNDAQAGLVLQALPPQRGTDIMAMEQRARRVEPLLAEARSMNAAEAVAVAIQPPASNSVPPPAAPLGIQDLAEPTTAEPTTAEPITVEPTTAERPAAVLTPVSAVPAPVPVAPAGTGSPRLLDPLTADVFSMDVTTRRSGPIPLDQPMPAGVVYKVQIGAFKQPIPDELFSDLTPVTGETVGNGLTRYAAGMFTSTQSAVRAAEAVRERGYRDAFVVAYQDGRRVSLAQAQRAIRSGAATEVVAELPVNPPTEIRTAPTAPVTAPTDSAQVAEQEVLAKYPGTAEQVLAQFAPPVDATAYYSDPNAAPARQVETVKGLFFTVQVGVYSKPTALDKLFNITPLNSERTETNKIRYTTGVFTDMDKARSRKDQTVGLGVRDAFVTAYLNGKRIPMRDARALIARFGPSVFVDPAIITR